MIADFECSVGVVGTTAYMAPEISNALRAWRERREPVDEALYSKAADVYSYGVTCFEILTGRYDLQSHDDRISVLNEQEMPPWVRDLIIGCWKQKPEDRPTITNRGIRLYKQYPQCSEGPPFNHRCYVMPRGPWDDDIDLKSLFLTN